MVTLLLRHLMTTNSFIVSDGTISQAAFIEARELYLLKGELPFNFSNNTQLQDLVTKSLEDGQIDIEAYNSITDQLNFFYGKENEHSLCYRRLF